MNAIDRYVQLTARPVKKPRAKPRDLESPVQRAVIAAIEYHAPRIYIAHVPNGGLRNPRVAAKLKRDGVRAGFPDLVLILPHGETAFVEVKAPGGTLSPEQKQFAEMCHRRGIKWACVDSVDRIREVLQMWGEL